MKTVRTQVFILLISFSGVSLSCRSGQATGNAADATESMVYKLVQQLGSDDENKREEATQRLLELGSDVAPQIRKASSTLSRKIRSRAERILQAFILAPVESKRRNWEAKLEELTPGMVEKDVGDHLRSLNAEFAGYAGGDTFTSKVYTLDSTWSLLVIYDGNTAMQTGAGNSRVPLASWRLFGFHEFVGEIGSDLFPLVKTIHEVRTLNPTTLIRAVRTLQAAGKDRALRALHTYRRLTITSGKRFEQHLSLEKVLLVARCLFVPRAKNSIMRKIISPGDSYWKIPGDVLKNDDWRSFPVVIHQDTPFLMIWRNQDWTFDKDPKEYLDFCEEFYDLREKHLLPGSPVDAVVSLFRSSHWKEVQKREGDPGENPRTPEFYLKMQALRALNSVYPLYDDEVRRAARDDAWDTHVSILRKLGPRWDSKVEDFVIKE